MASLREIQQSFAAAFLFDEDAEAACHVVANGLAPERRIGIYRNNARCNFHSTLAAAFPVVLALGGSAWFRQTALDYMRRHPSPSGNLHHVGERYPDYLERLLVGTPYAYFADVARLEWAYQEVLIAAEAEPFDPSSLAALPAEDYERLIFRLHPAARLLHSSYPVLAVWSAHQAHGEPVERIDLKAGPAHLLVLRRADHVEIRDIPRADYMLLSAFAQDRNLSAAADAVLVADPDADLGITLARCAELGVFAGLTLAPPVAERPGVLS